MKKEEVLEEIRNPKWYNLISNRSKLVPLPTRCESAGREQRAIARAKIEFLKNVIPRD
jgi:hypothetical protein